MRQAHEIVSECKAADADTAGEVAEANVAATAGPGGLPAGMSQVDIEPVALAWMYAPHLRFHPDEQNLPTDFRTALARGSLVYRNGRWFVDLPDGDRSKGSTSAPGGRPIPAGARIGEDLGSVGGSPLAPNTGGNTEPFPVGATPIDGKPDTGDGLDAKLRSAAETAATPITIGQDAVSLLAP
jgi:hypothetical protein